MVKVLLLAGGDSEERAISLRSGEAVATALRQAGHEVTSSEPADGMADDLIRDTDVVFPLVHGHGGEDGVMQAALDELGAVYVGSDAAASRLCFDKWHYKEILNEQSVLTPAGALLNAAPLQNQKLTRKPFVLKPYNGGSSVDTFIVRDIAGADWVAMEASLGRHGEMLIEELIEGVEITVGVVHDQALPVIEIIPPAHEEFDYENKYNGHTQELCPPRHLSQQSQTAAQALALKIHQLCDCRDYSRTDMIVTPGEALYVLETNTIPGMTDQSLLPKAAATAGILMPDLVDQLVQLALARNAS